VIIFYGLYRFIKRNEVILSDAGKHFRTRQGHRMLNDALQRDASFFD